PGGVAQLTPSESPNAHVIVVKDQRKAIKNALHARRVDVQASHPAPTLRLSRTDGRDLRHFYRTLPIMCFVSTDVPRRRSVSSPEAFIVAMQDYVRSIGATQT